MNRLQKKCFIAATGFHLLLLLILFIGPAFLSPKDRFDSMPVLTFVPLVTTDEMISGGGNRNAKPPAPAPETPTPNSAVAPVAPPEPVRVEKTEPLKPVVKEIQPNPNALDPAPDSKKHKIDVNTTLTVRKRNPKAIAKSSDSTSSDATALADARRRRTAFNSTLRELRGGLSTGTEIEMPGPGTGGVPYANFLQAVQSVYARAWQGRVPDGATDKDADALASVTIARDGSVISGRIIRSSGNAAVDGAAREVLEQVKYAAPLPESSAEDQRTVTIKFKVNTGQSAG